MNDLPADLFDGTLAADHPKIAALAAQLRERERRGGPVGRERALLGELLERSRKRHAVRLAALPRPTFPEDLPIAQKRDDIAALIQKHPVVIVCGETGSGKTTQLPKICLALKRGAAGLIGCTQPRRIAARSLAKRLAAELPGSPKGFVGHKIRFQDETRPESVVKVMTDGILLAEIHSDRELRAYDTIIVDEAHERSLNIDFLLGYLKRLVAVRPDLKVVVTSATIDTGRFSQFFDGAPVIEVSGRTYPVEVRYRPEFFEVQEEDDEPVDLSEALVKAVDEVHRTSREGDVLVFLPGEREIREAAEELRKHGPKGLEILPLFSRLSAEEQDRVFEPTGQRRVVLSTNVAETSLTVPGIHFVVDTGLARVKRYSPRQKIDQLRIEPISQAAAKQRAGRCGRVASGIAIRLYAEEDFDARAAFTTPEILRTSLASAILRMAALDLGEIALFPFVDPPTPRQIQDGYQVLFELGAIDEKRQLTPIGRELSRLPVDPKIGRMLIAAREFNCLSEMVILAAALSIQDPRDRPQDKRQESDRAHEEFRDDASDFVQLINLWKFFDEAFAHKKSNRKLYETCREHFLSYVRMREWRDLAGQLREMAGDLKIRDNSTPATYEQMHRALLTGLIGNVGVKALDGDHYLGPRGLQFHIWPGSGLKKNRPRWIMAGELQETTRIYARNVARIEPDWIEKAAAHLVERAWLEPHWDKARGEVVAYENVTLFGLVLAARRKVSFGRLDPVRAREIFIEGALVGGEFESPHPFWAHNRKLVREVEDLEHRARRPDVLVDDRAIVDFYASRLPDDVRDARSFDAWYRAGAQREPKLLFLAKSDLMRHGAESVTEELFPRQLQLGDTAFPLAYRFEPGHPMDGVTLDVPLAFLNQIVEAELDWLVPGMVRDKVAWTMKALPKRIRSQLIPATEHVTRFLETMSPRTPQRGDGPGSNLPLRQAVLAYASKLAGERLDDSIWSKEDMPAHLMMNIRVIDEAKRELAMGRELGELRKRLGEAASLTLSKAQPGMEREGITSWDLGELPETVSFRRGSQTLTGYPALVDEGASVVHPPHRHARPRARGASRRRQAVAVVRAQGAGAQPRARPFRLQPDRAQVPGHDRAREAQGRPARGGDGSRLRGRGRVAAYPEGVRGAEEARARAAARGGRRRAAPSRIDRRRRAAVRAGRRAELHARPRGAGREGVARAPGIPGLPRAHAVGAHGAPAALPQGLRSAAAEIPRQRRARPEARRHGAGAVEPVRGAREGRPRRRQVRRAPGGIPLADRGAARLALLAGAAHAAAGVGQAPAEVLGRAPALGPRCRHATSQG